MNLFENMDLTIYTLCNHRNNTRLLLSNVEITIRFPSKIFRRSMRIFGGWFNKFFRLFAHTWKFLLRDLNCSQYNGLNKFRSSYYLIKISVTLTFFAKEQSWPKVTGLLFLRRKMFLKFFLNVLFYPTCMTQTFKVLINNSGCGDTHIATFFSSSRVLDTFYWEKLEARVKF